MWKLHLRTIPEFKGGRKGKNNGREHNGLKESLDIQGTGSWNS